MRVVAAVKKNTYLVEVTETEIAHIVGCNYTSEPGFRETFGREIEVGMQFAVNKLWNSLNIVRNSFAVIHSLAVNLREQANVLDDVNKNLTDPFGE